MPFRSEAQRKFLYVNEPGIAKRWEKHTPKGAKLPERVSAKMSGPMMADDGFNKFETARIAQMLGIDFAEEDFTRDALQHGLNTELEHADVTGRAALDTAKIALAHLKERPDYYERLKEAEAAPPPATAPKLTVSRETLRQRMDNHHHEKMNNPPAPKLTVARANPKPKQAASDSGHIHVHVHLHKTLTPTALLIQKATQWNTPSQGAAPIQNTPSMPDFQELYYQPEDAEHKRRETEAAANRRRQAAKQNRGKFGFHGTNVPRTEPEIRYIPTIEMPSGHKLAITKPTFRAPKLDTQGKVKRFTMSAANLKDTKSAKMSRRVRARNKRRKGLNSY